MRILGFVAGTLAVVVVGTAVTLAVRRGPAPAASAIPVALARPGASDVDELRSALGRLMGVVQTQESGKDATCWTTVRLMDEHFAGKPMPDEVALLKIEACKTLVYQVWRAASAQGDGGVIHAAAIDAALPEDMRKAVALMTAVEPVFSGDALRSVMTRDYQRVTENKRYLYAIMGDAITGTGLFEGRRPDLAPLSAAGLAHLAAAATQITTAFLTACGELAQARGHAQITGADVHDAFAQALPRFAPEAAPVASRAAAARGAVDEGLLAITRRAIAGKIAALRAWNGKVWQNAADGSERQRELINRMTKARFDAEAFAALKRRLGRYVHYLALGVEPMQRNTFSASINGHPESLDDQSAATDYVTLAWTRNVLDQLFPRRIGANGDVTVDLMGLPSQRVPDKRRSVALLDYELDALRDTTLHWTLMEEAWAAPHARPADPFALEMIADRMSELAFLFIKECDAVAANQGKEVIGSDICDNILAGSQFAVMRDDPPEWTDEDRRAKEVLVATLAVPLFKDIGAEAGFPRACGAKRPVIAQGGPTELVDLMGSGIAVGDLDGDGLPDLFLAGDGGNRLLRNLGGRRFADVGEAWGLSDRDCDDAHHALFVDYDNDGLLDLFIVHSGGPSRLFRQDHRGHLTDVTATCGILTGAHAHDAVFLDVDDDGLLDCYVGHYGGAKPSLDGRNGGRNLLFRNRGDGTFEDITERAGVGSTGWTLATAAIDVDRDGRMDLFVANDYGRSELFRNNGDGTFSECGHRFGVDDRGSSMNASVIDIDGDGWMDLYITQIDMFSKSIGFVFPQGDSQITVNERILKSTFTIAGNKLFRNDHGHGFTAIDERTFEPGDRGWSWSGIFFDYDDDGDDDMYLTNGWVAQTPAADQAKQMFLRAGGKLFLVDREGPESYRGNGRGAVAVDLTGSGRMDLAVSNFDAPPVLLQNTCTAADHWIKVRLHGVHANRNGIGAVVTVTRAGAVPQAKQVSCGANYLSQDDTTLTFGLGGGEVEALTVAWPGGRTQAVAGPFVAGTTVEVTEAAAR